MTAAALSLTSVELAAGASEPAPELRLDGPNVIDYAGMVVDGQHVWQPVGIENPTRFIRQGTADPDGGCVFSSLSRMPAGTTVEVELAYDPDTCQSLFARGTPTASSSTSGASAGMHQDAMQGNSASGPDLLGSMSALAAGQQYFGRYTTQYDEPARWVPGTPVYDEGILPPVTRNATHVIWTPDAGSCAIGAGTTAYFGSTAEWFPTTGWQLDSHSFTNTPAGCYNGLRIDSFAKMSNNEFCAALVGGLLGFLVDPLIPDTKTEYHPNVVIGWNDGTTDGGGTWTKSGGCNDLLRIKHLEENWPY